MARPLRIEFAGALYHVTSRGDRREPIFEDEEDRALFLEVFSEVTKRFNWLCHAYCLMANHYHLVVETPDGNLSKGMRQLNGMYTQASNRKHKRSGHLFQGRFKAILVDKGNYLLKVARHVVLNPVRAGVVTRPEDYVWSSHRALMGKIPSPAWLSVECLLAQFADNRALARRRYGEFVREGVGRESLWVEVRQQIYLGDEKFVERVQRRAEVHGDQFSIPRAQRRGPAPPLERIAAKHRVREDAIVAAYATGAYSYRQIADHFGIHLATVGRIVRGADARMGNPKPVPA